MYWNCLDFLSIFIRYLTSSDITFLSLQYPFVTNVDGVVAQRLNCQRDDAW